MTSIFTKRKITLKAKINAQRAQRHILIKAIKMQNKENKCLTS